MPDSDNKKNTAVILAVGSPILATFLAFIPVRDETAEHIAYVCLQVFFVLVFFYSITELGGWAAKIREKLILYSDDISEDDTNRVRWRSAGIGSLITFFMCVGGAILFSKSAIEDGEPVLLLFVLVSVLVGYHYLSEMINMKELGIINGKLKLSSGPLFNVFFTMEEYEYTSTSKLIFRKIISPSNRQVTTSYYRFYIKTDAEEMAIAVAVDDLEQARYIQEKMAGAIFEKPIA